LIVDGKDDPQRNCPQLEGNLEMALGSDEESLLLEISCDLALDILDREDNSVLRGVKCKLNRVFIE
jgi:hypothetical protein